MPKKKKLFSVLSTLLTCLLVLTLLVPAVMGAIEVPECNDGPKVSPVFYEGNPSDLGYKVEPTQPGVVRSFNVTLNEVTYTVYHKVSNDDKSLMFWVDGGYSIVTKVVVKGGPDANIYNYNPAVSIDCNLVSPDFPNEGDIPKISHYDFAFAAPPVVQTGTITITKDLGDGQLTDEQQAKLFTVHVKGPDVDTDYTFSADVPRVLEKMTLGDYVITEKDIPAGYTFESVNNGSFTLDAKTNQEVTVTVTNSIDDIIDETGTITIVKEMLFNLPETMPQDAKEQWMAQAMNQGFTVNVSGPGYDKNHMIKANDDPKVKLINMAYGEYVVTEVLPLPSGYVFKGVQGGVFTLGEQNQDVTVTVTNELTIREDDPPQVGAVLIRKIVENATDAQKNEKFTIRVTSGGVLVEEVEISQNDGWVSVELEEGSYEFKEVNIKKGFKFVSITHQSITVTEDSEHEITVTNKAELPPTGGISLLGLGALLGLSGLVLKKRIR